MARKTPKADSNCILLLYLHWIVYQFDVLYPAACMYHGLYITKNKCLENMNVTAGRQSIYFCKVEGQIASIFLRSRFPNACFYKVSFHLRLRLSGLLHQQNCRYFCLHLLYLYSDGGS